MTTNPPVTVTYTLEDLFTRFEQSISKQIAEVNEKVDRQSAETKQQVVEVKQQFVEVKQQFAEVKQQFAEVNQKLVKLEVGQATLAGEIKALDATVAGIGKRIDNAEFMNRGVAIALIAAAST